MPKHWIENQAVSGSESIKLLSYIFTTVFSTRRQTLFCSWIHREKLHCLGATSSKTDTGKIVTLAVGSQMVQQDQDMGIHATRNTKCKSRSTCSKRQTLIHWQTSFLTSTVSPTVPYFCRWYHQSALCSKSNDNIVCDRLLFKVFLAHFPSWLMNRTTEIPF